MRFTGPVLMTLGTVIIIGCISWNPTRVAFWFAGPVIVLIGCLSLVIDLVRGIILSKDEARSKD